MKKLLRRVTVNIHVIIKSSNKNFTILLSAYSILDSIYPIQLFKRFTFIQVMISFILLYVMVLLLVCLKMIRKKKIVVKNFNNNHSLSVLYGDILNNKKNEQKNVIIPVNRCFDTNVNNNLISENTLHGQLFKKIFDKNINIDQEIDKQLGNLELFSEVLDKSEKPDGKLQRYPAGTIVEIHDGHLRYWLVAFTKFDSDLHASVTKSEYLSCILSILDYAKKKSQGFPIYLPLIGGGHSSAYQNEQEILTFMIEWFKLNKDEVNCDINIVVDGRARDRISILK